MSNKGESNPNLIPADEIKPARLELDEVRKKLAGAKGPKYWRTLEELSGQKAFGELLEREFPHQHSELLDPVSRRDFMKLAGASMALAGLAGCTRQPLEQILPYVRQPEELVLGRPIFYATAMPFATGSFDAARSERLFQHLLQPERALAEMIRVTKPGGWVVVADADWYSLSIDTREVDIERRLAEVRADRFLHNAYAGRHLYRQFTAHGLGALQIEVLPVWLRRFGTWGDRFANFQMGLSWIFLFLLGPLFFPQEPPDDRPSDPAGRAGHHGATLPGLRHQTLLPGVDPRRLRRLEPISRMRS